MPPELDNPFSLDTAISEKLAKLPSDQTDGTPKYGGETDTNRNLQPQAWEIADYHESKPSTSLDRPLDAVSAFQILPDLTDTGIHEVLTRIGPVKFNGSALLCRCPDCEAPMTIRLWLGLADCWRCPASVALDERIVAKISEQVETKRRELPKPPPMPAEFFAPPALETVAPRVSTGAASRVDVEPEISDELDRLTQGSALARLLRRMLRITPAWLVSFLLHLIALLILAMIFFGDPTASEFDEAITLSTFLDSSDREGGDVRIEDPIDTLQDDVAIAAKMVKGETEIRDNIIQAAKDALELRVDPQSQIRLPELSTVRKNITTNVGHSMSFAARDPRVRAEIVEKEGGTNLTEASVARGLRWLASVQNDDGSWSLKNYSRSDRAGNKGDSMGTALALLPFLGAGQTHEFGVYKKNVAGGLRWLLENQKQNGDLRGTTSQAGMYAHGQATIVLCEALALTGDRQFFDPVQRAVGYIEAAQHRAGGWRYRPGQAGDTSVFGWQMMALQSARAAGMDVEINPMTFTRADNFLDTVSSQPRRGSKLLSGAAYGYQPRREATDVMTAEAILCRMYLGWRKDDPRMKSAVNWLVKENLPSSKDQNLYYWYYGTQVMHHYGGDPWQKWNQRVRTLLIESQSRRGRYPGSWAPDDFEWGEKGGRIYTTAMAVCTLEVYYRHLPLFKQLELE